MRREKSGARKVRLEKWVEKSEAKRKVRREKSVTKWGVKSEPRKVG